MTAGRLGKMPAAAARLRVGVGRDGQLTDERYPAGPVEDFVGQQVRIAVLAAVEDVALFLVVDRRGQRGVGAFLRRRGGRLRVSHGRRGGPGHSPARAPVTSGVGPSVARHSRPFRGRGPTLLSGRGI